MSVLMINGSPHARGCTFTALSTVAGQLKKKGIESEIIHIGVKPTAGCIACGKCAESGHCRRGGASAAFDRLNKYFTINRMPVVSSQYWNATHGRRPEEQAHDLEGLQIMRTLGDNMAWLIRCIAAGRAAGIKPPEMEPWQPTHFIMQ